MQLEGLVEGGVSARKRAWTSRSSQRVGSIALLKNGLHFSSFGSFGHLAPVVLGSSRWPLRLGVPGTGPCNGSWWIDFPSNGRVSLFETNGAGLELSSGGTKNRETL